MFISYAHTDRERALALRDAFTARGLRVWLDDTTIDTFESISGAIERGLTRSKALVALYSHAYPTRRACQWELTAAFLAAERLGDPRRRVLVINPESSAQHIEPVQLRDALFVGDADEAAADAVAVHVAGLEGGLGDLGASVGPPWFGQRPVGSTRFVGRVVDMWKVHSALHAGDVALITGARGHALAQVTGMGGIGKSLLAEEYALRFAAAFPGGVFWLRALGHEDGSEPPSPEGRAAQRDAQLDRFARELGLDTSDLAPDELHVALAHALDARRQPFLWIVDDLPGERARREFDSWLAPGRRGKTLLTTRSRGYHAVGTQIDLGVLSQDEGAELLSRHRQPSGGEEIEAARGLVADLGGHALALDVAGAALKAEQGVRSFAQYRAALANPSDDELELATRFAGELPTGHEPSITRTLARSVARLGDDGLDFLRLASVVAVQPIPASLVIDVFAHANGLDADAARGRAVAAMHDAMVLSLAETVDDGDGSRQVHTLVSRTIRLLERDTERSTTLADAAIETLTLQLRASSSTDIAVVATTLAHARHLAGPLSDHAQCLLLAAVAGHDRYRGDLRSARALYQQVVEALRLLRGDEHSDTLMSTEGLAMTLSEMGHPGVARVLQQRVLDARRRLEGDEHPSTLRSMGNLAYVLSAAGDLEGARVLGERVLESQRRVSGYEHPCTLTTINNLAMVLSELGDLTAARVLHERVLEAQRRKRGDEHPGTLLSMNNLAVVLSDLGDLTAARVLHERVLEARRRKRGDEHPDTVRSMNNLAHTLIALNELVDARILHERVLEWRRRELGDEHRETLASMSSLGSTLHGLGDLGGARALQERAVEVSRRVLGDEHPDTLSSINHLADTLASLGDLMDARALREQVLEARRRVLRHEHPDTLTSMSDVATTMHGLGDWEGARVLYEEALEAKRRVLGDGHSDTLTSLGNLAVTLHALGDLEGARAKQEQALEALRRVSGREHPDTLASMNNLALTLRAMGDPRRARVLHERVVEVSRRVSGDEHPDTVISMKNLADTLASLGDLDAARALHKQVFEARRRVLGDEHIDTLTSMNTLAEMSYKLGDLEGASPLLERLLEVSRRVLGDNHPDTVIWKANLETVLRSLDAAGSTSQMTHSPVDPPEEMLPPDPRLIATLDLRDPRRHPVAQEMIWGRDPDDVHAMGLALEDEHQFGAASDCYLRSLEIFRERVDRRGEAQALNSVGRVCANLEPREEAISYFEESLYISRELGDRPAAALTLDNLGRTHWSQGRADKAIECFQQSVDVYREHADRYGEARMLGSLGRGYADTGRSREAIDFYEQSLAIMRDLGGHQEEELLMLAHQGRLHADAGRWKDSIGYFEQCRSISHELGDRYLEAQALIQLGVAARELGYVATAERHLREALAIHKKLGSPEAQQVHALLNEGKRPSRWKRGRRRANG